jgi:hypothetical protein
MRWDATLVAGHIAHKLGPRVRTQGSISEAAMTAKLRNVRDKGYIAKGYMRNLMHLFPVDKVGDIHLMYDCT